MTFARPRTVQNPYAAFYADHDYTAAFDASPGERVGEPFVRRGGLVRWSLMLLGAGSAFYFFNHPIEREALFEAVKAIAAPNTEGKIAPGPPELAAKLAPDVAPLPLPATEREIAEAPGSTVGTAVDNPTVDQPAPIDTVAALPAVEPEAETDHIPRTPLPPPTFDAADPLKKRAVAVGLHPDLSRTLLAKLTKADYENARVAVDRALAETPDGGSFTWPAKAGAKQAIFEVHFVRGAENCRRYIVVVAKDRWATTAAPMEKCGIKAPQAATKNGTAPSQAPS